jgi:1-acyl-sn-glycerol-3-phosphate acyltransferase
MNDYDTSWARTRAASMVRASFASLVIKPAMALLGSPVVHLDPSLADLRGPAIFAPNHLSHADTGLVLAALPSSLRRHTVVAAAADNFFTGPVVSALSALFIGAIPMERTKVARRSLEAAADLLDSGWSVLLYPEGTRSTDGNLQDFKGGAAYLALRCDVPIVPVYLTGTDQLLPRGARRPRRHNCTITVGAPITAHDGERARQLTSRVQAAVAELGPGG